MLLFVPFVAVRSIVDDDPANPFFKDYIKSLVSRTFMPILMGVFMYFYLGLLNIIPDLHVGISPIADMFVRLLILAGASSITLRLEV